jgi:hypothetical protein
MMEFPHRAGFRWHALCKKAHCRVQEGTLPHTEISSGSRLRIVAKLREHQFILEKRGPGLYLSIQSKD